MHCSGSSFRAWAITGWGLGLLCAAASGCVPVVADYAPSLDDPSQIDVPLVLVCVDQTGKKIFGDGEPIPARYTEDGPNFSPPLTWTDGPSGTREWALVCEDLDAKPKPWVHWVIYKLPGRLRHLFEGVPANMPDLWEPEGALQGPNSWYEHNIGYYGPFPPVGGGVHRYRFTLYALDTLLDLPPGATKEQLLAAMEGHVLAETTLTGTFERPWNWRDPYDFSPREPDSPSDLPDLGPGPPEPVELEEAASVETSDLGPGPPEPKIEAEPTTPATPHDSPDAAGDS